MTAPASAVSTATTVETLAAGPARRRRRRWTRFILPVYSWLVIAYLVLPIGVMVLYSFNRVTTGLPQVSFAWNGFTLQWYREWSNIPGLTAAFWLSVRLAIASTVFSTVIGTLLALALVRYQGRRFRGKTLIEQTMFLNIAAPEIVLGASLLGLFVTINLARGRRHIDRVVTGAGPDDQFQLAGGQHRFRDSRAADDQHIRLLFGDRFGERAIGVKVNCPDTAVDGVGFQLGEQPAPWPCQHCGVHWSL